MRKLGGLIVLLVFVLAGCIRDGFDTIPVNQAFIATVNLKDASITFLDGESLDPIGQWELEDYFTGAVLLPDNDHIAIYGKEMSFVKVYSLSKGELVDEWKVGSGIVHMTLINEQTELALIDQYQDSIRVFSLEGEELRSNDVGKNPISIFEDAANEQLFVVNFGDEKISVLHTKTLEPLKEIAINPSSTGIILRKDYGELWVGGHGKGETIEENVHIFSADRGNLLRTLRAPSMPIKFLEWNDSVFIVSHGSNTIYKYNTISKEMQSQVVGVNPFEIVRFQNYVAVASYDSDEVYLLDPNYFTIEKKVKVGKGPFQIFVRE